MTLPKDELLHRLSLVLEVPESDLEVLRNADAEVINEFLIHLAQPGTPEREDLESKLSGNSGDFPALWVNAEESR